MPSIAYRSKTRAAADCCSLTLTVNHHILVGAASETVHYVNKAGFPRDVDVLARASIILNISGFCNGTQILAKDILDSSLAHYLVEYFQTNSSGLGLQSVSSVSLDEEHGLAQVVLTPSRSLPKEPYIFRPHVFLLALDLTFSWQIASSQSITSSMNPANHPFSGKLSLPFRTTLENVFGRFVTWQLVKQYPFIFGTWCQQLDVETSYFPTVSKSVLNIIRRSRNKGFRSKCNRLIQVMREQTLDIFSEASRSLSAYIPPEMQMAIEERRFTLSDGDVILLALERVFRQGLSRPLYKGRAFPHKQDDDTDDEALSKEHELSGPEYSSGLVNADLFDPAPVHLGGLFSIFDMPSPVLADTKLGLDDEEILCNDAWDDQIPTDLGLGIRCCEYSSQPDTLLIMDEVMSSDGSLATVATHQAQDILTSASSDSDIGIFSAESDDDVGKRTGTLPPVYLSSLPTQRFFGCQRGQRGKSLRISEALDHARHIGFTATNQDFSALSDGEGHAPGCESTLLAMGPRKDNLHLEHASGGSVALGEHTSHYIPTLLVTGSLYDGGGYQLSEQEECEPGETRQGNFEIENWDDESDILLDI